MFGTQCYVDDAQPWLGMQDCPAAAVAEVPWWKKLLNVVKEVQPLVKDIQSGNVIVPVPGQPGSPIVPQPKQGMSTGAKVLIGLGVAGAVALVGYGVYEARKASKK